MNHPISFVQSTLRLNSVAKPEQRCFVAIPTVRASACSLPLRLTRSRKLVRRTTAILVTGWLMAAGILLPRVDAATMQIGSTNVNSGSSFTLPLTVDAGANPVGSVSVTITYDSTLLRITGYTWGDTSEFINPNTFSVFTNTIGQIGFLAQQTSSFTSPTGLVSVAKFTFLSLGSTGTSALALSSDAEVDDANTLNPLTLSTVDGSVTISAPLTCAVTPTNAAICAGGSQLFVATPSGGLAPYTYSWSNGPSTQSNTVSATGTYTCTIHDFNSSSAQGSGHLTVNPLPTAPTAGNNGPVCAGGTLNLTASTVSGASYSWTGPNSFTSPSQNPSIGSVTTAASGLYSVTITVSGCTSTASTTTATINPTSVGGTATPGTNTLCSGTSTTISLSGQTGAIVRWQYSLNNSTWSNIVSTANPYSTGTLSATTYFRAIVQSGVCSTTNSTAAQVTVNPTVTPSVTIAADVGTNLCAGSSVTFSATPVNGGGSPTYVWKKNTVVVGGSGNTYTDGSLANNDKIDCQLTSTADCASPTTANAPQITMRVNSPSVGGTATATTNTVCNGSGTTISLASQTGSIVKWQSAPDNSTWSDIVSTANPYSTGNLSATTYFRAIVQSGNCPTTNSTSAQVTVSPASVGGTATPTAATLCSGNGTTITLSGQTGVIVKWQSSTNNATWLDIVSTANPYSTAVLTATTYFRAVVQSGVCSTTNSSSAQVTVSGVVAPSVTVGASPGTNICTGSSVTFTATPVNGGGAPTYVWKKNTVVVGDSSNTYTDGSLATGDKIDCQLTSSSTCASPSTANAPQITMTVNAIPSAPTPGDNGPICAGSTLNLTASAVSSATYSWTGPNSFSSAQQNPSISSATTAASGVYRVTVTVSGCTSTGATTTVTVNPIPATPAAGNNGPVCLGSTLNLTASTVSGATYSWSGPNGFSSSQQNPSISNATVAASGTYNVTATVSNCPSLAGTTTATVNPVSVGGTATPAAGTVCSGSGTTIPLTGKTGIIVKWQSSPDNSTWSDIVSTNSPYSTGNLSATTYFRAVVQSGACPAANSSSAQVKVNQTPAAPTASNNGPVCVGSPLNLTATTVAGATYSWSGPIGFNSAQQNPILSNVTSAAGGLYSVTVTISNCTSVAGTTTAAISPVSIGGTATPTAATVCSGNGTTVLLAGQTGTISKWQSSSNNVDWSDIVSTANPYSTGPLTTTTSFRAVVHSGVCSSTNSSTAQVSVTGSVTPSVTVVADPGTNNCAGIPVIFTATPVNGGSTPTYVWKKNNVVVGGTGNTYSDAGLVQEDKIDCQLTSSFSCASPATASATSIIMTVRSVPATPAAGNNGPLCVGSVLNLSATTVSGATYSWSGPNGFTATQQNPAISNVTVAASGLYSVTVTVSNCTSVAGTTTVTVNPSTVGGTATPTDVAVCSGSGTLITLTGQTGAIVKWQSSTNNASWSDIVSTANPYSTGNLTGTTYFRALVQSGACATTNSTSAQVTVSGVVTPAVTVAADPGATICVGALVTFTATPVNGGGAPVYLWKKNGSVVGGSGNSYTDGSLVNGDTIDCQLTSSISCASPSTATATTITVSVNQVPAAPTAGNTGPFCVGATFNLTASTASGATYSWSGPNGFTSSQQNPSISNATAAASGLYSVTVRVNGCTSAAGATTASVLTDTTLPEIQTCAAAVTNTANASGQAPLPDFTAGVHATDNCTPVGLLVVTQVPSAGTLVGVGTTPVTLTVRDAAGNPASCDTSFTVLPSVPPVITTAPAVTNAFLQYGTRTVLVAGDTNIFVVGATAPEGVELSYQWQFGDGITNAVSPLNTATHVYSDTNCGPYVASVTVNAGVASVSSNLTVVVACDFLAITKLQTGLNFGKVNSDSISLKVKLNLAGITNLTQLTGIPVVVDVADAQVSFTLDKKGHGVGPNGSCILTSTKPTKKLAGYWTATLTLSKGNWRNAWVNYGMDNATHKSPGVSVNMPVVLLVGDEVFAAAPSLHYTATYKKTGTAK